jgi:hypothetical protein
MVVGNTNNLNSRTDEENTAWNRTGAMQQHS